MSNDDNAKISSELGGDLQRALGRFMENAVREWRTALADLERRQAGYVPPGERDDLLALLDYTRLAVDVFERMGRDGAGRIDHLTPEDFSWRDVAAEAARDEAAGLALWDRLKQTARDELAIGKTGAEAVEGYESRPLARAKYLAVRRALADGLQPRNDMERLLIDGMAQAWVMHQQWLHKHVRTESLDVMRVDRDARQRGEWQPPRLSDVEAIDRAAMMADRFQRQFLRLMKTYRDQRRLLGSVVVAAGGQLNVAEQQVNFGVQSDDAEGHAD